MGNQMNIIAAFGVQGNPPDTFARKKKGINKLTIAMIGVKSGVPFFVEEWAWFSFLCFPEGQRCPFGVPFSP